MGVARRVGGGLGNPNRRPGPGTLAEGLHWGNRAEASGSGRPALPRACGLAETRPVRRLGLGHSTRSDPASACAEAATRALRGLGGADPDAALLVATGAWGGTAQARAGLAAARNELGLDQIAGAGLDGLMVGGSEWTGEPAACVLAFSGSGAEAAHVEAVAGREDSLAEELAAGFETPPAPGDLILVFAEPHSLDGARVARSLDRLAPATVVGIAAGDGEGEGQPVWAGGDVIRGGVAALRIPAARGTCSVRSLLSQAGRPVGEPRPITRCRGHWITRIDDRPALDVYREAVPAPLRDDLPRAARSVLVSLERPVGASARGRRVRNVVGFDAARGAISLAEAPRPGDLASVVVLDQAAAREDLGRLEAALRGPAPLGALYLNCRARARALFEHEGYELGRFEALASGRPVLGLMGSHVYGRADAGEPLALHTYAALATLIEA